MSKLAPFALLALVLLSTAPASAARAADDPSSLEALDAYIVKSMADWQVPGLALAIVKDGKVIHSRGYGTRTIGKSEPVDENTLFAVGSQTKAFTAAAIAILVDEGKLSWDDKVTDRLPGFQLYDPSTTREITVRDLLTHRSGLERGDVLWYLTDLPRDQIVHQVRFLKPTWSFRSTFGYQNIMFLTAGQLVPAVTGKSWDDFIEERILDPLGMERSSTTIRALSSQTNVATPHESVDGIAVPVPWKNIDNIAPAGSINSSAAEMTRWVRMQLAEGELDGKRIVSPAQIAEMHRPQMLMGKNPEMVVLFPEADFASYGLGWFTYVYRGATVVEHGGAIDGMRAQIAMVPKQELGIVLLANLGGTSFTEALRYRILDAFLGEPEHDWSSSMRETYGKLLASAEDAQAKHKAARLTGTSPSRPLPDYAGVYTHEMLGELRITEQSGALAVAYGVPAPGKLEHWHLDTFEAKDWPAPGNDTPLVFRFDADARVVGVEVAGLGTFDRKPDEAKSAGAAGENR